MKSGEFMLYDIDKTLDLIIKRQESREVCDLVYDIESYIIDLMYASDERLEEVSPNVQEKRGRAKASEYIVNEKETVAVLQLLEPVMTEMGIPRQIKGFRMVEECVIEGARQTINKRPYHLRDMYPMLAQKYNVSCNNAEKLCRYACSCIDINRMTVAKFPFLEILLRGTYENITLRETVDVLVNYVVENCKFTAKERR